MVDTTISTILKNTFYAAHAKGVKFNLRAEDESRTPLTKRQGDDLLNLVNDFLKNLSAVKDVAEIQFEISSGGYVSLYQFGPTDPTMTVNLPLMRRCYNGRDSVTFLDYLESLKIVFPVAIKMVEWAKQFKVRTSSVSLEYETSSYESYMKRLSVFEKKVLPQLVEKYNKHDLDIRLGSDARASFNYYYNTYNNTARLSMGFSLGDVNTPDFSDLAESMITENAASLMEITDHFLKHEKMCSDMSLDFHDAHLRKYYPQMKQHYIAAIDELNNELLKNTPEEKLSVSFTIAQNTGFDYSGSDRKNFRFTLPYVSPRLVLQTDSKDAPQIYADINKTFFNIVEWSKKTGVGHLSFDRIMSDKIPNVTYMQDLLEALEKFIEDNIEIGQRANMSIFLANLSMDIKNNSLSYFSIHVPDCYDDELKDWFPNYLSGMKVS